MDVLQYSAAVFVAAESGFQTFGFALFHINRSMSVRWGRAEHEWRRRYCYCRMLPLPSWNTDCTSAIHVWWCEYSTHIYYIFTFNMRALEHRMSVNSEAWTEHITSILLKGSYLSLDFSISTIFPLLFHCSCFSLHCISFPILCIQHSLNSNSN